MEIEEDKHIAKEKQRILNLESKLEQNKYHVKNSFLLLECYNNLQQYDKANELRSKMYKYVTFTENQWIDWITEELTEAETSGDSNKKKDVIKIFDLAMDEGYYPTVAEMYLKFIDNLIEKKIVTKQKSKYIIEKVIGLFFQDFTVGSSIFKQAKKIELKFQNKFSSQQITEKEYKDSQNQLRQLYQRELKLGLVEITKSWEEYSIWEQDEVQKKKAEQIYNKTFNEVLILSMDLEDEYIQSSDKYEFMINLIQKQKDDEKKLIENTKVINFFEKCLSFIENTREINFWKLYIQYLKDIETPASHLSKIMCRATKNCKADLDLHTEYLRVLEKRQAPFDEIENELDRLLYTYKNANDDRYILYTSFLSYTVRNLKTVDNPYEVDSSTLNDDYINPSNISIMRKAYEKAVKYFTKLKEELESEEDEQTEENSDSTLTVYINEIILKHAEIECYIIRDKEQLNQIMEKFVKENGENISCWKKYYEFERVLGKTSTMRGILKRACMYVKDEPLAIHQILVDFEQDYGNVDLLEKAIQKQIQKYQEINEKEAAAAQEQEQGQTETNEENIIIQVEQVAQDQSTVHEEHQNNHQQQKTSNKRKPSHDITEEEDINKKVKLDQEKTAIDQDGTKPTVFIKNLPSNCTEASISQLFENRDHIKAIRIVKSKHGGMNKGFAYIDFSSMEEANNACLMMNDALVEGQKLYVAISAPPKKQTGQEDSTAYLSNLPFKITEEEIRQAFPDHEINQVRMIRDGNGDFRGFAYVEFKNETDLQNAIEKFNQNPFIKKRKVFCEKSQGLAKDRLKGLNDTLEENDQNHKNKHKKDSQNNFTVFLKNISFKALESDIQEYFKDLQIEGIVIARDIETNQPKGFAFVTFKDRSSYQQALNMKKGSIRKREFEIQKYDKPVPGLKKASDVQEINQIENKSNDDFKKYLFKK
ncbi:RNA recognition motif protein (macronuclear) [Tetrahymena thermophila SB210]|uniref:RNA recognition motif protein n=1 Tax=Tetrahymena thermophila (strain SB210) TaxID=312017 RepID=W7XJW4_TETTS|nr:RNA recognition motif protein [Tetrahymena thermophila SB210]EWS74384.1 RNA recognition motif protein [Tetrahymena thermophila SB210]|eukprot:XP_012653061.1 RNA recognition motif protein [Tetrahymena thermophila SB210]